MLFHEFASQEERRSFGGSAFIEVQFCKLPKNTNVKKIVAINRINHWQNDSLYISDEETFYKEYCNIFNCGIYNNLQSGTFDMFGINYYDSTLIDSIIAKLQQDTPADYKILIEWLIKAKEYNGFYILGL